LQLPWLVLSRQTLWFSASMALLLCNIVDALFTLCAVHTGAAYEANPLLSELAVGDPLRFVLVKHGLVSLGLVLLWRTRRHKLARVGLFTATPAYSLLVVYHIVMASQVLG
jgi:hypothetical protein